MNWFEDDEFWVDMYPFLFTTERLEGAAGETDMILQLADRECSSALDLCCGPGRHAIELAHKGIAVTGVDRTRYYLDKARAAAVEAGVNVEWVLDDMRSFSRPSSFDLIISMFTSFGYFEEDGVDLEVLERIRANLAAGGRLVLDVISKEWLAANYNETVSTRLEDGSTRVDRHRVVEDWHRIENEWTLIREGNARTFRLLVTIYSGYELKQLLYKAGFSEVRLYGSLEGQPYGHGSERLVAVATR